MLFEMMVKTVTVDKAGSFLVLLTDEDDKKVLPISIGPFEAQAIAMVLQGKAPPRPLTHDLLKSMCENLGGNLEKVVITDIQDSTFYSELYLNYKDQTLIVDSRPSDAIAFALRCGVGIYMLPKMVEFTYDYSDLISQQNDEDEDEGSDENLY